MSVLMFMGGVVVALAGVIAIVFGLPVKEFSFGNTLIMAGAAGVIGGLILIGIGAAIAQLQRIADLLGARPLSRSGRVESFEQPGGRLGHGVPFPPKPKTEGGRPRAGHEEEFKPAVEDAHAAPSLQNPDVPVMAGAEIEEASLSPRQMPPASPRHVTEFPEPPKPAAFAPQPDEPPAQPSFDPAWRTPQRSSPPNYFDSMWPAESRAPKAAGPTPSRAESIPRAPSTPEPKRPEADRPRAEEPTRAVAILKSGVVDGMGYTLYVDGSIEAELPDGTLRFASINELRAHLEKNS